MSTCEVRDLLERHHREAYGWALTCCAWDASEAEGILQTVYLKVLEGKARYDGRSAFKTWLFAVIRQTAADERRRRWLYRLRLARYGEHDRLAVDGERPHEALSRSQRHEQLRRALTALPRQQQEVLRLVFYHELTLQEAAAVMQVSLGSARVHYERGKKRLRRGLEGAKITDAS